MSLFIQIYEIVEIILCELVGRVEFLYYLNIFSKSSFLTTHDLEGICIINLQIKKLQMLFFGPVHLYILVGFSILQRY